MCLLNDTFFAFMNSFKSAPSKQVCNKEVFYLTDMDVSKTSQSVSTNPLYKVRELKIYPDNRKVLKKKEERQKEKKKNTFLILPYLNIVLVHYAEYEAPIV